MDDLKLLLESIKSFNTITIFRHQRPDGDAVGSQLGLKQFIKDNFKDKHVYALGTDTYDRYPVVDQVDDNQIIGSLAIVLDTANADRISDERYKLASKIIKIDHHPAVEEFGTLNYTNSSSAATAEVLTDIFTSENFKNYLISKECASYLYSGLLTDTLSFKTSNTTSNTLKVASILAECNIDINDINNHLFNISYADYNFCSYLRTKINFQNGLAYILLNQNDLNEHQISASKARSYIAELNGVTEFLIWVVFTENEKHLYDASLRSKKPYIINSIANKYNGGGHANACGIKDLDKMQIEQLLLDLKQII